jgi:hypothetical protein
MTSQTTKPSASNPPKPPGKLIRFDFPPNATPEEIAAAIEKLKAQHAPKP